MGRSVKGYTRLMAPLIHQHRAALIALCQKHRVTRLDVFGSATTDAFDPENSDVDLLVEFDDSQVARPFHNYFELKRALEMLLGREVDLVEPEGIRNKYYREGIEETRVGFYAA